MGLDGAVGNAQLARDLLVGQTAGDPGEYLALTAGKQVEVGVALLPGDVGDLLKNGFTY